MKKMRALRWIAGAVFIAGLVSAPVTVDPRAGVRTSRACAQIDHVPATGTCCAQLYAICIIGSFREVNRYYLTEGRCPS